MAGVNHDPAASVEVRREADASVDFSRLKSGPPEAAKSRSFGRSEAPAGHGWKGRCNSSEAHRFAVSTERGDDSRRKTERGTEARTSGSRMAR